MISALVACNWSQIRFFILANVPTCMSEVFWPNFDQINISYRRPCSLWIVNLLTWQKAPEGGFDEKSWEMACNWLMMTSSGDDNRPSGSLGLLTDKTKKKKNKINRRQSMKPPSLRLRGLIKKKKKPKAEQETAQPTAARFKKHYFAATEYTWHSATEIKCHEGTVYHLTLRQTANGKNETVAVCL